VDANQTILKNYYNAVSDLYDGKSTPEQWPVNIHILDALKTYPQQPSTLLDLGAGTGLTIDAVMQSVQLTKVVAVDVADQMLDILEQKHPELNVECVQDSVEHFMTTDTRQFDLITAIGILDFPADLPTIVSQLGDHLTPSGLALFNYVIPQKEGQAEMIYPSRAVPGTLMQVHCWKTEEINAHLQQWGEILIDKEVPGHTPSPDIGRMRFHFVAVRKS